jgi:hypothetical protein
MPGFLANENMPGEAVRATRAAGLFVAWVREESPGISDDEVLAASLTRDLVLVTFDKDFGEMAFRSGADGTRGVILLRPKLRSPEYPARFTVEVLSRPVEWGGHFAVAQEGRLRLVPLPVRPG